MDYTMEDAMSEVHTALLFLDKSRGHFISIFTPSVQCIDVFTNWTKLCVDEKKKCGMCDQTEPRMDE